MRGKTRPEPEIPDHEVLRKIGGGSYGEVWLARGVTGALRAVKVVRRGDFEDERGFEREFEGILKYEPISRNHPGLVNVLHVGRSLEGDENEFYYYVMELGEDIQSGSKINAVEYEPRNLRTDMKQAKGKPIDVHEVIDVGLCLAEALEHLHEQGLAHRDVKPSNIIFVDGRAKLADIGLVAVRGQRTFVGTEGFVPPEGPGSAQADVYGLGKVLYEMATGKDRLEFPELPEEMPEGGNVKRWRALNQVVCDICEPRVSKRTIKTAAALADALRRLQRGKRIKRRIQGRVLFLAPVLTCILLLAWFLSEFISKPVQVEPPTPLVIVQSESAKLEYGYIKVISEPEGVEVYDGEGEYQGITPLRNIRMRAGQRYEFEFRLDGYRTDRAEGVVEANKTQVVEKVMGIYAPPVAGEEWIDNFGIYYQPVDNNHISSGFVRRVQWQRFIRATNRKADVVFIRYSESGVLRSIALVTPEDALAYCQWHTELAEEEGYLNEIQYISPQMELGFSNPQVSPEIKQKDLMPFRCLVQNIPFAQLEIQTQPEGASVFLNDEYMGVTPLTLPRVIPGRSTLSFQLEGYRRVSRRVNLEDGANEKVKVNLQRNNSVVFGVPWENSLGMRFVPLGDDLLVSIWETRVIDYQAYVKEVAKAALPNPGFEQTSMHPVVQVARADAEGFCHWLTKRERKRERISADVTYRLLTDAEWSLLAGIEENAGDLPSIREFRPEQIFPWGREWPPQEAAFAVGNLADESAAQAEDVRRSRTLLNYIDGYEKTSPVGMFPPNLLGLYDLSGNVHEWVSDDYQGDGKYGVLRGGGWNSYLKKDLFVTARNAVRVTKRSNLYGFRVVLARPAQALDGVPSDEDNKENEK